VNNVRQWYEVRGNPYGDGFTSLICYARFTHREVVVITSMGEYRMQRQAPTSGSIWYTPQGCLRCGLSASYKMALDHNTGYLCPECSEHINKVKV